MGNHLFDVLSLRAEQSAKRHVAIANADLASFPEQQFAQLYHRTFAQVVGARLKAEPEYGKLLPSRTQNHVNAL